MIYDFNSCTYKFLKKVTNRTIRVHTPDFRMRKYMYLLLKRCENIASGAEYSAQNIYFCKKRSQTMHLVKSPLLKLFFLKLLYFTLLEITLPPLPSLYL